MALSVDPTTYIITVPKADLTLIQSSPTEIRELDLNSFRLDLKAWEATENGMPHPVTHSHNTEVSLGGLTYARVIEILDPYSITFEDGQYAVNLTGANSNVGDKVNVNQVSVRSANSAGLISSPDIEYSSFNEGVIIDTVEGVPGTLFPRGTIRLKCNNWADAILIAEYRGLNTFYIHSDLTLDSDADIDGYVLEGRSDLITDIVVEAGANVSQCLFSQFNISGTLDGQNELSNCVINDLAYVNGHILNCALGGTITLAGNSDLTIEGCMMTDGTITPVVDMGGSGQNLILANYVGKIQVENMTGSGNMAGIGLSAGVIVLDSTTVTAGIIHVSGVGKLVDESGNYIPTGTWNGGVTIYNELINEDTISHAVNTGVIETNGNITLQQALSIVLAALAGQTENDMTTFKDPSGANTRISGTVVSGDRTNVNLTPSS